MNWTKKLIFPFISVVISSVIGIGVLELMFGSWIQHDQWKDADALNIVRDRKVIYSTEHLYGKSMPTVAYSRDRYGLRGGCKSPKNTAILTLGGSTTDQRYIADGQTYQDILARRFKDKNGKGICIANAGVDGHSTFGHLASFEKWFPLIPDLKPVYVLFYLGVNDAGFRDGPNAGYDVRKIEGESKIRSSLREKSALYDLFRRLRDVFSSISNTSIYAGHSIRPSVSDYTETHTSQEIEKMVRQNTDLFKVRMQSLVEKAKELGAQPICVSQPHLFVMGHGGISKGIAKVFEYENSFFNGLDYQASISALNDSMKHICVQAGGYYIDIASKEFAASDFYDVVHMSPGGAEKLGEYLFEEFEKQGIAERLK